MAPLSPAPRVQNLLQTEIRDAEAKPDITFEEVGSMIDVFCSIQARAAPVGPAPCFPAHRRIHAAGSARGVRSTHPPSRLRAAALRGFPPLPGQVACTAATETGEAPAAEEPAVSQLLSQLPLRRQSIAPLRVSGNSAARPESRGVSSEAAAAAAGAKPPRSPMGRFGNAANTVRKSVHYAAMMQPAVGKAGAAPGGSVGPSAWGAS